MAARAPPAARRLRRGHSTGFRWLSRSRWSASGAICAAALMARATIRIAAIHHGKPHRPVPCEPSENGFADTPAFHEFDIDAVHAVCPAHHICSIEAAFVDEEGQGGLAVEFRSRHPPPRVGGACSTYSTPRSASQRHMRMASDRFPAAICVHPQCRRWLIGARRLPHRFEHRLIRLDAVGTAQLDFEGAGHGSAPASHARAVAPPRAG
jgi:hypothetical protein